MTDLKRTDDAKNEPSEPHAFSHLSKPVLRRLCALKKYQMEEIGVMVKFYKRYSELEKEMEGEYKPVRDKRTAVVNGLHEPIDDDCTLPLMHGMTDEEAKQLADNAQQEITTLKGIPNFWQTVFRNASGLDGWLFDCDQGVLKYLTDITSELTPAQPGFLLSFHFAAENEFFTNSVIKKQYTWTMEPDPDDPFDYDGPYVTASESEQINWRDDSKNLQLIHGNNTFFVFFSPGVKTMGSPDSPEQTLASAVAAYEDLKLGEILRQQIIPNAVLYYTGEVEQEGESSDEVEFQDGRHSGGSMSE